MNFFPPVWCISVELNIWKRLIQAVSQHVGPTISEVSKAKMFVRMCVVFDVVSKLQTLLRYNSPTTHLHRRCSKWLERRSMYNGNFAKLRNSSTRRWSGKGLHADRGWSFGASSVKIRSCALSKHKSGHKFEAGSDRTRICDMNFVHCFCVAWSDCHVLWNSLYKEERRRGRLITRWRWAESILKRNFRRIRRSD